tara:strand:+ start:5926 stop:6771 length:846 start_codon:yes stop_codon:yes gene_type:complete
MIKNKKKYLILFSILMVMLLSISYDFEPSEDNIGVIEIKGTIMDSKDIIKSLDEFNNRSDIKSIILRLDTPGGAVAPSQEIYEKVKAISFQNKKPIIASISSVAASGGYYIAIGADEIIANPGSITGSIGVIINFPIARELVDKVGLKFNTVKSGKMKDAGSPYRNPTDDENVFFQEIVNDLHSQFVKEVSVQRNLNIDKLSSMTDGRIFTGKQAYELGLIDSIGTFEDALNISKNLANISGSTNLVYPKDKKGGLIKMLFDESKIWLNTMDNIPMYLYNN